MNRLAHELAEQFQLDHHFVNDSIQAIAPKVRDRALSIEQCAVLLADYINVDEDLFKDAIEAFCARSQRSVVDVFSS